MEFVSYFCRGLWLGRVGLQPPARSGHVHPYYWWFVKVFQRYYFLQSLWMAYNWGPQLWLINWLKILTFVSHYQKGFDSLWEVQLKTHGFQLNCISMCAWILPALPCTSQLCWRVEGSRLFSQGGMGLDIYQLTSVSAVHGIWTYWIMYWSELKILQCSWSFYWDQEEVKGETALWSQSSRAAHGFSKSQWSVAGLGALHLHPGVLSVWSVVSHWNFLPLFYQHFGSKLLKSLRQWWFVLDAITDQTCL